MGEVTLLQDHYCVPHVSVRVVPGGENFIFSPQPNNDDGNFTIDNGTF